MDWKHLLGHWTLILEIVDCSTVRQNQQQDYIDAMLHHPEDSKKVSFRLALFRQDANTIVQDGQNGM